MRVPLLLFPQLKNRSVLAVSGPTTDQQPPFAWTEAWADTPHRGQPDVFDFAWETYTVTSNE